jgi:hypothetical protein
MIMEDPSNKGFYIAVYNGQTGMGEIAEGEEAQNITGKTREDIMSNAALIWGVDIEDCNIEFIFNKPKSIAVRSASLRARRKDSGLVHYREWVTPEEKEQLIKRLAELRDKLIEGI